MRIMTRKLTLTCALGCAIALLTATHARAMNVSTNAGMSQEMTNATLAYLASSGTTQTPYQKLEALYNRAAPMQLHQFLTPESPNLGSWECSGLVQPNEPVSKMWINTEVPALVTGKIVISKAVPGNGPLFPGVPEKDRTVLFITNIPNHGFFAVSAKELGKLFVKYKFNLVAYPGVSVTNLMYASDTASWATDTYRTINGLTIVKQFTANKKYAKNNNGYWYCWEQKPKPSGN